LKREKHNEMFAKGKSISSSRNSWTRFVPVVSRHSITKGTIVSYVVARVMPGCDDSGTGETATTSVRTRVLDGGVVGDGARASDDWNPGAGAARAGNASPVVAIQPDQIPFGQFSRHPAAPALPGDELHVVAEPDGHTTGRSWTQCGLPRYPVGVRQSRQRATQHAQAGRRQTVRMMNHLELFAIRQHR